MSDIVFEILKLVVMIMALIITRYLVPWLKETVSTNNLAVVEKWAKYAVLKAQQVMTSESGTERKTYVTDFLKEMLIAKNISLTDEQIDVLIESAVKQMKIDESRTSN